MLRPYLLISRHSNCNTKMKRKNSFELNFDEIESAIYMIQHRRFIDGKSHHNKAPPTLGLVIPYK